MDYYDILLAKKLSGGGGGDVEIVELDVTENGTYREAGKAYRPVKVNVPPPTLITKNITANGTYNASDDSADGYSSVTVDVEGYQTKALENVPADVASFNDAVALPMTKLKVSIVPVQSGSGDPSPSNPRAISGWTGANIGVNGKNFCSIGSASFTRYKQYPLLLPSGTYTLSSTVTSTDTDGNDCYFGIYDNSDNLLIGARLTRTDRTSHTFTLNSNSSYIILYAGHNSSQSVGDDAIWANVQVEVGSSATTFEPYNGTTIPISLGQTVYGGELDVTSGMGVKTHVKVDLGTLNWSKNTETETYQDWRSNSIASLIKTIPTTETPIAWCEEYEVIRRGSQTLPYTIGVTTAGNLVIYTSPNEYASGADLKAALMGVGFVYELATPTDFTFNSTSVKSLLGVNNIWADSGQVLEGEYFISL